jgi:hypothetical protein
MTRATMNVTFCAALCAWAETRVAQQVAAGRTGPWWLLLMASRRITSRQWGLRVAALAPMLKGVRMRIGAALVVIWLVIGALAGQQRGYYKNSDTSCAKASTIAVTVVAGPLNYVGANPKVHCSVPQPSK